jgi:uncharacterized protein (TIGR02145 family)
LAISFSQENPTTVKDIDGNIYHAVAIGTQVWMKENLKTTKYNDGSPIPHVTDDSLWGKLATAGYCWYGDNATRGKASLGALYNWYAVETGKLCPAGWHVATDEDWTTLMNNFGDYEVTGGKLKETGDNGFTALPAGCRDADSGLCYLMNQAAFWWTSTAEYPSATIKDDQDKAWIRVIFFDQNSIKKNAFSKRSGFSVRCVKD